MITCTIIDASGNKIGSFHPKGEKNILDEAADEGIDIPFSCHAGACMSCAARIKTGMELIDREKDGAKYIETDEDVVLTCVAGVKPEFAEDGKEHSLEMELLM